MHYNHLSKITSLSTYTSNFTYTLGLLCSHKLRKIIDAEQQLDLSFVSSYWYFKPLEQPSKHLAYSYKLFRQDPPIMQSCKQSQKIIAIASSQKAGRKIKRQVASQIQQEAESIIWRNLSEFEIVEHILTVYNSQI